MSNLSKIATKLKKIQCKEKLDINSPTLPQDFVKDLGKMTNEKGEKLITPPWFVELALLTSDFRVKDVYTSGAAQIGKSLVNALLQTHLTTKYEAYTLYMFSQENVLQKMVPLQFIPLFNKWCEIYNIETIPGESRNTRLMQCGSGAAIFSYANTTKSGGSNKEGLAVAGSVVVSFSADIVLCDEASKWQEGAIDPVYRRLDNSRISTQPIRLIGTPGSGAGIEKYIRNADRDFYPHVKCEHCGKISLLHPLGNLFQPRVITKEDGSKKTIYFTTSGKPLEWYHKDEEKPIETAYFGCNHCGAELTNEIRINAFFQCLKTGETLNEFITTTLSNCDPSWPWKVGITLSPLLRQRKLNLAADIVRGGIETTNAEDWQQQRLGIPYQGESGNLTIKQIKDTINPPPKNYTKEFILAGLDQGRNYDYLSVVKFILPIEFKQMSLIELWENTIREVKFLEAVERNSIESICEKYNVESGVIDNEPNVTTAAQLARKLNWNLCDQKTSQKDDIKAIIVKDGGEEFDCYAIRNSLFLQRVRLNFITMAWDGKPLYRFPKEITKWLYNNSELSPVRHLCSISYNTATGSWIRPKDHNDDLYFALVFAEAAFRLVLENYAYTYWYRKL